MTCPTPAAHSLAVLELAGAGQFEKIRDLFAPSLRPMVTAAALRVAWAAELDRQGPVSSIGAPVIEPAGPGTTLVRVPVTCANGALTALVSVADAGWLVGLQLAPAVATEPTAPWQPPAYADPARFAEHDIVLGSGPLAVGGTLSMPRETARLPAVVLLGGSGVLDRDETIGRNKPFRDLAWGLATRGVAVLRFDKVTYAHPSEVKAAEDFTVADEYVPHALAAVRLLEQHPAVDAERIFVLGHSLGGTVAPRVAAGEPAVAGLVILAGGTQPLHWTIVRQIRYLASLDPASAGASESAIEAVTAQARLVDSRGLSRSTPSGDLPFGVPAAYWLDLRDYKPVAVAATLDRPILILQGGRDYQVTVADDLARWKTGLADRANVTIRVYPPDNHLFFPGAGPSAPAEYEPAQHMDGAVVEDIADWVTTSPKPPAM
jgi:uncharacterized protein